MDSIQRGAPAEDIQFIDGFPAQECAEQAAQPQDVIEMPVCEENAVEVLEACARLQDLTLRPFATIDQKTVLIMFDNLCGKPALCRRRGSRRAKKKYFEQNGILW